MDELVELFTFDGRASRSRFWLVVVPGIALLALYLLFFAALGELFGPIVLLPMLGVVWAGSWMGLAVIVKRLHDLERPGWHFFLLGIPIYNLYLWLLLLCRGGTVGRNVYGPDPFLRRRRCRVRSHSP